MLLSELHWQHPERYSSRQQSRIKLGGFVGKMSFGGDLGRFMPLLKLGEYLQVGKGTSFGLGKYKIREGYEQISDNDTRNR